MSDNFLALMTHDTKGPAIFRLAEVMAGSQLIPPHLRGKVEDVFIALAMADQMGENPVVVLQNIYVVSGRAGWSASYMIARANKSGVFRGRIDWRVSGKGDSLAVTAFAVLADSGQAVEMTADMAMAVAEKWTNNAKYKSMPEVMLRYRSATLLIRMYAADVMLGMHTDVELETIPAEPRGTVLPAAAKPNPAIARIADAGRVNDPVPEVRAREVIEVAPVDDDPPAEQEAPAPKPATARDIAATLAAGAARGASQSDLEAVVQSDRANWTEPDLRAIGAHLRTLKILPKPAAQADDEGA